MDLESMNAELLRQVEQLDRINSTVRSIRPPKESPAVDTAEESISIAEEALATIGDETAGEDPLDLADSIVSGEFFKQEIKNEPVDLSIYEEILGDVPETQVKEAVEEPVVAPELTQVPAIAKSSVKVGNASISYDALKSTLSDYKSIIEKVKLDYPEVADYEDNIGKTFAFSMDKIANSAELLPAGTKLPKAEEFGPLRMKLIDAENRLDSISGPAGDPRAIVLTKALNVARDKAGIVKADFIPGTDLALALDDNDNYVKNVEAGLEQPDWLKEQLLQLSIGGSVVNTLTGGILAPAKALFKSAEVVPQLLKAAPTIKSIEEASTLGEVLKAGFGNKASEVDNAIYPTVTSKEQGLPRARTAFTGGEAQVKDLAQELNTGKIVKYDIPEEPDPLFTSTAVGNVLNKEATALNRASEELSTMFKRNEDGISIYTPQPGQTPEDVLIGEGLMRIAPDVEGDPNNLDIFNNFYRNELLKGASKEEAAVRATYQTGMIMDQKLLPEGMLKPKRNILFQLGDRFRRRYVTAAEGLRDWERRISGRDKKFFGNTNFSDPVTEGFIYHVSRSHSESNLWYKHGVYGTNQFGDLVRRPDADALNSPAKILEHYSTTANIPQSMLIQYMQLRRLNRDLAEVRKGNGKRVLKVGEQFDNLEEVQAKVDEVMGEMKSQYKEMDFDAMAKNFGRFFKDVTNSSAARNGILDADSAKRMVEFYGDDFWPRTKVNKGVKGGFFSAVLGGNKGFKDAKTAATDFDDGMTSLSLYLKGIAGANNANRARAHIVGLFQQSDEAWNQVFGISRSQYESAIKGEEQVGIPQAVTAKMDDLKVGEYVDGLDSVDTLTGAVMPAPTDAPAGVLGYAAIIKNGKRVVLPIKDQGIYEAMKKTVPSIPPQAEWARNMQALAQGWQSVQRAGIVVNPEFWYRVILPESWNATRNKSGIALPIYNTIKGLGTLATDAQFADEFAALMGSPDNLLAPVASPPVSLAELSAKRADTFWGYPLKSLKAINKALTSTYKTADLSNRVDAYVSALNNGLSQQDAISAAAEITTDMRMSGSSEALQLANRNIFLFLNPIIKGIDREIRLAKNAPKQFLKKGAVGLSSFYVLQDILLHDNEEYMNAPAEKLSKNFLIPGEDGEPGTWVPNNFGFISRIFSVPGLVMREIRATHGDIVANQIGVGLYEQALAQSLESGDDVTYEFLKAMGPDIYAKVKATKEGFAKVSEEQVPRLLEAMVKDGSPFFPASWISLIQSKDPTTGKDVDINSIENNYGVNTSSIAFAANELTAIPPEMIDMFGSAIGGWWYNKLSQATTTDEFLEDQFPDMPKGIPEVGQRPFAGNNKWDTEAKAIWYNVTNKMYNSGDFMRYKTASENIGKGNPIEAKKAKEWWQANKDNLPLFETYDAYRREISSLRNAQRALLGSGKSKDLMKAEYEKLNDDLEYMYKKFQKELFSAEIYEGWTKDNYGSNGMLP